MRSLFLFLCLLICVSGCSQDAEYISLTSADADAAKSAYEDYKQAEAKWVKVQDRIHHDYIDAKGKSTAISADIRCFNCVSPMMDWEFSKDFKILVPKQIPSSFTSTGTINCGDFYFQDGTKPRLNWNAPTTVR